MRADFYRRPGNKGWGLGCCILALLVGWMGCSGGSSATYPVTGNVKRPDGEPLRGGRILFQPIGASSDAARGVIAEDGTFRLGTYSAGDGAVAGTHKVTISPAVPEEALDDPASIVRYRSTIDLRYQNVDTTPLELSVKNDGSTNHFEIVLEPLSTQRK